MNTLHVWDNVLLPSQLTASNVAKQCYSNQVETTRDEFEESATDLIDGATCKIDFW